MGPGQSNGRLTGPSSLQDIAGNSSVSVTQTESQSALRTVVASGTTEVSTSSGFESLSVESQLTQVQPGSETPITTEKITSTSSAVLESTFSAVSLITSTGIIESTGRIVIFLIREPTPNTQKRSFNRRQNTDKRFVGNGNPDTCTYAESFNLAQEQLFIDGVPFFYNGQDYTELRARPVPQVGAVTRIFITSGRLLEIRNPDVPDGAGFCLARDGTVYVTFTSGPASCVPIILEVYDQRQSQNGRLVGLDTTTGAAETATSTSKAISSRSSTNIEAKDTSTAESSHESATESSSISQYQSVAPISEPTTSSKASTAESSSASTSSSFTTGITTSETSTEPNVSSPVPRESSTEGVSLTTALTSTSAVSTSSETEESTSIKPASSETSEAGTTSSEESTSSVEPETSTVESTTAASESETTTVQSATSTESTTSETSTSESNTLQSSTLQSTSSQSTSSESTTNRPSTTIAQTTSNSPTTTTLGATPTNADECTALSNPYIASNGDRFDLSCSSNVVFLSGGGSEQADLVDCLEDCSTDPGCEGVQYTKANQNCVFLVQKVGTVPNNAYDVAFRG
ncbi:hypothetical protein FOC4_g10006503 [Fusarium odoratissimum]|uniref:Apple domain-containing protein n=1 Tax=Fusarium oxysporum f. sp. cubense (strain race 4) TaxID=2502994 RepID=N1R9C4_FUSC4|nr:hypothetical protein FOC4_g10006503 [Fusarium odoratissimum]